ncbi:MAG: DegV family protein [Thermoanaerobaculia bacterium]
MTRPAVLIVDPQASRRKELAQGLARFGYEVVPAPDGRAGRRFAAGLGPGVIVADASVEGFGDGSVLPELRRATGTVTRLLVLGSQAADEERLPEEVLFLATGHLESPELVRRLRLLLVGWELKLDPDARLQSLVGDLALTPALEVIRGLGRVRASGRLLLEDAEVVLERGEVIACRAGAARGVKAFCRVGTRTDGPFRVVLGRPGVHREIEEDLESLVIRAIEDRVPDPPSPRSRLEVRLGPGFFDQEFSRLEQRVLAKAQDAKTVAALLDLLEETDGALLRALDRLRDRGVLALREPETAVRIVTDSTADLPERLVREHGIRVVPLIVRFGDRIFRDGVDLTPRDFYDLLETSSHHPVTAPPTPGEFLEVYRQEVGQRDVVSIHLSSALSETFAHAGQGTRSGAKELREPREGDERTRPVLELVDSRQVSLGLGLLALFGARMARRRQGAGEIAERLRGMSGRMRVLFVVDTLEYLARGGRIGRARAWMGSLLGIKPILGVEKGEVVPLEKVRGGRAAHPKMLELLHQGLDPERPAVVAIAHARAPVWADRLRQLLEGELPLAEVLMGEMGPVVGTHAGPGTVGVALFQPESDEEARLIGPLGR